MILLLLMAGLSAGASAQDRDSLLVVFWNLENFFDYRSDNKPQYWTKGRFYAKCDGVAKTLLRIADRYGRLPDAVGFAEVENARVLRRLLDATALRKLDYRIVHFDSPDLRGIDAALLYRASRLELIDARPCHLYTPDSTILATRDILLVRLRGPDGADTAFLVNHHPSKYGGASLSAPKRQTAVRRLRRLADSLLHAGVPRILAMGDMNDTPDNPVFKELEPALRNLAYPLHRQGKGSIKYEGRWELIDLFFASPAASIGPMRILEIPFLMTPDKACAGYKPLRTYSGPRYLGGVSDHLPITITLLNKCAPHFIYATLRMTK